MWIKSDNVICRTDEFSRFYIEELPNGSFGIFGKESDELSVILGSYRTIRRTMEVFDTLYSAFERGDKAFAMPKSEDRW